jgi:hypothetical protein
LLFPAADHRKDRLGKPREEEVSNFPEGELVFGSDHGDKWYAIPGVPGLELSGDLRLRGPGGLRKLRRDANGRPYVLARVVGRRSRGGRARQARVMLHRAVLAVQLGRRLGPDELVCHRDDDKTNNWPQNLYLGDRRSNAADALRNGRHATGSRHPRAKLSDEQVRQVRLALGRGERGRDLARAYGVHRSTISRIKHGVRRRAG